MNTVSGVITIKIGLPSLWKGVCSKGMYFHTVVPFLGRLFTIYPEYTIYQNFLKVVVHVIIIDQWNQKLTIWNPQPVVSELNSILKSALGLVIGYWQTLQTLFRRHVLLKLQEIKGWMKLFKVPVQDHFPSLYAETIDPPVLSVLWLKGGFMYRKANRKSQNICLLCKMAEILPALSSPLEANFILTHLCRKDYSTLILWTGPFPIKRVSG